MQAENTTNAVRTYISGKLTWTEQLNLLQTSPSVLITRTRNTPDERVRRHRLRKCGYTRRVESLYRILKRLSLPPSAAAKTTYKPKLYEQITYPGERVQIDVKFVPLKCLANKEQRLYQYAPTLFQTTAEKLDIDTS